MNTTVKSWGRRAAKNEALFREVNERIFSATEAFEAEGLEVLCECSNAECAETLHLSITEYQLIRARGNRFAVLAGHEDPTVESIVERNERFIVVEKIGESGDVARDLDPRG